MTADEIRDACKALVARGTKPTRLETRPLTDAFYKLPGNAAGGSLHCVLDDGNYERCHIEWSIGHAEERGDETAVWLARVLLLMSNSQRRRGA